MRRLLVLAAVLAAGCSGGIAQEQYDQVVAERDGLVGQLQAAQAETAAVAAQLEAEQTRAAGLEGSLNTARAQLTSETGRADENAVRADDLQNQLEVAALALENGRTLLDQARAERDALLILYDPQIQEARAEVEPVAFELACTMGRANARANVQPPRATTIIGALEPDYPGINLTDILDETTLAAEADRCHDDERAIIAEEELQAQLTAPKSNGFFTVGDEIAPGRWRSTGSGDDCYWERLDANQNIIDNHFGEAGGTVTIRASDYEVRFSDCGMWEYLGP